MLRQLPELESCIVMWLNLGLLPCMVTNSKIDLDLCLTGSRVPGYIKRNQTGKVTHIPSLNLPVTITFSGLLFQDVKMTKCNEHPTFPADSPAPGPLNQFPVLLDTHYIT